MNADYPYLTDAEVKAIEDDATDITRDLFGPGNVKDFYVNAGSGFAMQTCHAVNEERRKVAVHGIVPTVLDAPHTIEHDSSKNELVLAWYDREHLLGRILEVRIQPHEIVADFLPSVTTQAM